MAVLKFLDPDDKKWKELSVVSDGVSFIPSIDPVTNVLTWSNNAYLPNPDPVSLKATGIEMYPTKANFPGEADASENGVYIDKQTSAIYRWDATQKTYLPLSASGAGQAVVFVTTVPTPENAEVGVVYALKKGNAFELWGKNNGVMEMLEGAEDGKEVYTFTSYTEFPVIGSKDCLYVATSTNTTYRYDDITGKYYTVGDRLTSVEAGHEKDSELDQITADDVINAFHS